MGVSLALTCRCACLAEPRAEVGGAAAAVHTGSTAAPPPVPPGPPSNPAQSRTAAPAISRSLAPCLPSPPPRATPLLDILALELPGAPCTGLTRPSPSLCTFPYSSQILRRFGVPLLSGCLAVRMVTNSELDGIVVRNFVFPPTFHHNDFFSSLLRIILR